MSKICGSVCLSSQCVSSRERDMIAWSLRAWFRRRQLCVITSMTGHDRRRSAVGFSKPLWSCVFLWSPTITLYYTRSQHNSYWQKVTQNIVQAWLLELVTVQPAGFLFWYIKRWLLKSTCVITNVPPKSSSWLLCSNEH